MTGLLSALVACGVAVGPAAGDGPDLGFDYRAFIADHIALVNRGDARAAFEHLAARTKQPNGFEPGREDMTRKFSMIHAMAGAPDGHEIVAVQRQAGRICRLFAVSYHANSSMLYTYRFERTAGGWKLLNFGMSQNADDLEKVMPVVPVGRR